MTLSEFAMYATGFQFGNGLHGDDTIYIDRSDALGIPGKWIANQARGKKLLTKGGMWITPANITEAAQLDKFLFDTKEDAAAVAVKIAKIELEDGDLTPYGKAYQFGPGQKGDTTTWVNRATKHGHPDLWMINRKFGNVLFGTSLEWVDILEADITTPEGVANLFWPTLESALSLAASLAGVGSDDLTDLIDIEDLTNFANDGDGGTETDVPDAE